MDNQKRKVYNLRFKRAYKPRDKSNCRNQPTIIGSICNLMANEKVIIALVLIREPQKKDVTIPIGFKISSDAIPSGFKPYSLHVDNIVTINVPGSQEIPAMIVAIGDDSKDVISSYKIFHSKLKNLKPPGLSAKICTWISISNLSIIKVREISMNSITKAEYNSFINYCTFLNSKKPVTRSSTTHEVVTLSDGEIPSTSSGKTAKNLFQADSQEKVSDEYIFNISKEKIGRMKTFMGSQTLPRSIRWFFSQSLILHENSLEILSRIKSEQKEEKNEEEKIKDLRIIPEEDETSENGNITFIEGVLPVRSVKYKRFCGTLVSHIEDREPTVVLTNLVRICFPAHWVNNVTVAGQGGRKSILSLWNYHNPLTFPCSGTYDKDLGKTRFDALLDHVLRQCGRKSYDILTRRLLSNALGKAMHYVRTQNSCKKASVYNTGFSKNDYKDDEEEEQEDDDDENSDGLETSFQQMLKNQSDDEKGYEDDDDYVLPPPKVRKFNPDRIHDEESEQSVISGKQKTIEVDMRSEKSCTSQGSNIPKEKTVEEVALSNSNVPIALNEKTESVPDSEKVPANDHQNDNDENEIDNDKLDSTESKNQDLDAQEDFFDDDDDDFLKDFDPDIVDDHVQLFESPGAGRQNQRSILAETIKQHLNQANKTSTPKKNPESLPGNVILDQRATQDKIDRNNATSSESGNYTDNNSELASVRESTTFDRNTKRKESAFSDSECKKIKKSHRDWSMADRQSTSDGESKSKENQQEAPNPEVLAFLNNPANAALVANLLATREKAKVNK